MSLENTRQSQQKKLFQLPTKQEKQQLEEQLLKELSVVPEAIYAEGASDRLNYYLENKKVDADVYYESKFKPLENDGGSASSEEAYQKLMAQAKVQEYGSNFDPAVYDPQAVVQHPDELIESILHKSVFLNKSFSSLIRPPSSQLQQPTTSQTAASQSAQSSRFPGFTTTMKNYIPFPPKS